jgi:hypothetical protein
MSRRLGLRALDQVLDLAREHVREVGFNNRGPVVDKVITYAHGQVGEPWCVDTVIWGYGHAGSTIVRPGYPRAVAAMLTAGVKATTKPRSGDVIRYRFDHTGLVVGWRRYVGGKLVRCPRWLASHVLAVEGNTGGGGAMESDSRNGGDGVHVKLRPLTVVQDYLAVPR